VSVLRFIWRHKRKAMALLGGAAVAAWRALAS